MRSVAVLGHSDLRRNKGVHYFLRIHVVIVAAPEDGRTPYSSVSQFEDTP